MQGERKPAKYPAARKHPNRAEFHAVLTRVEEASDRPPSGARGHRVQLTREAAVAALDSLVGMALDNTPRLDGHDSRSKVGVITAARVEGSDLVIEGHIFARDFPEVMRELRARGGALGLSYELADAQVEDVHAAVWKLTEVTFTGAAILQRSKAAYNKTWIELKEGRTNMNREQAAELVTAAQRMAAASEALGESIARIDAQQEQLSERVGRMVAAVEEQETGLRARVAELEKEKRDMEEKLASAERASVPLASVDLARSRGEAPRPQHEHHRSHHDTPRKTLSPMVSALLAKQGVETAEGIEAAALEASLASLSIEQRIAVKAQMARAGLID